MCHSSMPRSPKFGGLRSRKISKDSCCNEKRTLSTIHGGLAGYAANLSPSHSVSNPLFLAFSEMDEIDHQKSRDIDLGEMISSCSSSRLSAVVSRQLWSCRRDLISACKFFAQRNSEISEIVEAIENRK